MDEPMGRPLMPDDAGALYRVTYASGYVGLVDAEGLRIAQLDAASPARDGGAAIERVECLQGDHWVLHDPWHQAVASAEGQDRSVITAAPSEAPPRRSLLERLADLKAVIVQRRSRGHTQGQSQDRGMDL
jgi:hypothetical protein